MTPAPIDIQDTLIRTAQSTREHLPTNGLSLFIVTPSSEQALKVAPLLAERLHPNIDTNGVLWMETAIGRNGEAGWEVVLRVREVTVRLEDCVIGKGASIKEGTRS